MQCSVLLQQPLYLKTKTWSSEPAIWQCSWLVHDLLLSLAETGPPSSSSLMLLFLNIPIALREELSRQLGWEGLEYFTSRQLHYLIWRLQARWGDGLCTACSPLFSAFPPPTPLFFYFCPVSKLFEGNMVFCIMTHDRHPLVRMFSLPRFIRFGVGGKICVCNWFTLLYTWNEQNIVGQLYSNKIFFLKLATSHALQFSVKVPKNKGAVIATI